MRCIQRLTVALLLGSLVVVTGCTEKFEVLITNYRDIPIKVAVGQFHAPDFTGNPPNDFTDQELIKLELIELRARESRTLAYSSASGGFWLRWRMLEPLTEPKRLVTIDLLRDKPVIDVR